jgi:hypothetical protein
MATEFLASEGDHWYQSKTLDIYYPSATTILAKYPKGKQFEAYLAGLSSAEEGKEKLDAAGKRGTHIHEATELLEQGVTLKRMDYTLDEWQMLGSFVKWYKKYKPEAIAIEKSLVSDILKTGGTIDRVYRIDGVLTLLDIKTSGAVYESYWCQTACYSKLWEEHTGEKIEQTAILRLSNKLKKLGYQYVLHTQDEIEQDFKVFQAVQTIWQYEHADKQPTLVDVPDELSL